MEDVGRLLNVSPGGHPPRKHNGPLGAFRPQRAVGLGHQNFPAGIAAPPSQSPGNSDQWRKTLPLIEKQSQGERQQPASASAAGITAAVEEAHRAGRKISAHAIGEEGILAGVEAGVDSIGHGVGLPETLVGEMARRGTRYVATLTAVSPIAVDGEKDGQAPPAIAEAKAVPGGSGALRLPRSPPSVGLHPSMTKISREGDRCHWWERGEIVHFVTRPIGGNGSVGSREASRSR